MRRIGALIVATAALAVGAAPAYAVLPPAPDTGGVTGGDALATGGDGGSANTGNVQALNGNSVALGLGGKADADGGNTSAQSGDAYGGDGGNAKAVGGDAKSWNPKHDDRGNRGDEHSDHQDWTEHDGQDRGDCGCGDEGPKGHDDGYESHDGGYDKGHEKGSWKDKGEAPKGHGGEAKAEGGRGGFANTGNVQFLNGNAFALSFGKEDVEKLQRNDRYGGGRHEGAEANGGDTCAESGDAYGGDGGNAFALGGDAESIL